MKKVIVISTSLRPNSNSEKLAQCFANGAKDAGNDVQIISLKGKNIKFCVGCMTCQKTGTCIFKDDAIQIAETVLNADVVVWATPIYYYEMSGQMKTIIDRMNLMFSKDYKFREVYFLSTAADTDDTVPERAISSLQGWIDCYPKSEIKGTLFCGGVDEPNEIKGNTKLDDAYKMGKNV